MEPDDWAGLTHFEASEFSEPSAMGMEFMIWLDVVREEAGVPFKVTSSYRTHAHNAAVGGAMDSAHCDIPCQAVDLMPASSHDRFRILLAAINKGGVRIGLYPNGSVHLDRTEDTRPAEVIWVTVSNPARP